MAVIINDPGVKSRKKHVIESSETDDEIRERVRATQQRCVLVPVIEVHHEYPDHIKVDGVRYDLHFTQDGDYTFCVISHTGDKRLHPHRWGGFTYRNPKDPMDIERGRHEAFKSAAREISTYHFFQARPNPGYSADLLMTHFRRAYWKACQKIKEQK